MTFTEAEIEHGRWLFAQSCQFVRGVVSLDQLPPADLPEIAFAGRSNVGKSSLVNALTGRSTLARTSNTPGRTRELNYFRLGPAAGPALMLVDLPGYGYARASRSLIERWTDLVKTFLKGRPNLQRVCLLVDARHGLKDSDREIMKMLNDTAVSYQIVLTKADKLKTSEQQDVLRRVEEEASRQVAAHPEVLLTSAVKGWGIAELRAHIAAFAAR